MKSILLTAILICPLFFNSAFSQKDRGTEKRSQARELFLKANHLNFSNHEDSIAMSYNLLGKVLLLNDQHPFAHESKICIDYKRGNYDKALETALKYTQSMPGWGNSWAYLGIVQHKLKDTVSASKSFFTALHKYREEAREWKRDKNTVSNIELKMAIVKNFLGEEVPLFSSATSKKGLRNNTTTVTIPEMASIDSYVDKFMSYNGIQFF